MTEAPEATRLELDLLKEARERLKQWAEDTMMRCEIAELEDYAKRHMLASLAIELMVIALPRSMTKIEFLRIMEIVYDKSEKFHHTRKRGPR
jgi:hypothetical protein